MAEDEVINVSSKGRNETERLLSNFAETPFTLNGEHYRSVESFWQGLYFPEGSAQREYIATLPGNIAKRERRRRPPGVFPINYQGRTIAPGSSEHHELMRQAIRAKLEQHPLVLKLLLVTGQKRIIHVLTDQNGRVLPDSKVIPGEVFAQILMDLREEFLHKTIS